MGFVITEYKSVPEDERGWDFSRLPKRINPGDKYKRGKGLNGQEYSEFSGICDHGPEQLLECYRNCDREYSAYDFHQICGRCEHHHGISAIRGYTVDPGIHSIFAARFIRGLTESCKPTAPPNRHPCYVYFVTDGTDAIKIGVAKNLTNRLAGIQTGNPRKVSVLYAIECISEGHAHRLETLLHDAYAQYRLQGEWFLINDRLQHGELREWYSPNKIIKEEQ